MLVPNKQETAWSGRILR